MDVKRIFQHDDGSVYGIAERPTGFRVVVWQSEDSWQELPGAMDPARSMRTAVMRFLEKLAKTAPAAPQQLRVTLDAPAEAYSAFRCFAAFMTFLECTPDIGEKKEWEFIEDDPPDVALRLGKGLIGIELTEWLDQEQTEDDVVRGQFEEELRNDALSHAEAQGLPHSWGVDSLAIRLEVIENSNGRMTFPPKGRDRDKVIQELWAFLHGEAMNQSAEAANPYATTWDKPAWPASRLFLRHELPDSLGRCFDSIAVWASSMAGTIQVTVCRGKGADTPQRAFTALVDGIKNKTEKYRTAPSPRSDKDLGAMWLIVYYDSARWANSPYHGFQSLIGSAAKSEEKAIADEARKQIAAHGAGIFDTVYLIFTHRRQVACIWP